MQMGVTADHIGSCLNLPNLGGGAALKENTNMKYRHCYNYVLPSFCPLIFCKREKA